MRLRAFVLLLLLSSSILTLVALGAVWMVFRPKGSEIYLTGSGASGTFTYFSYLGGVRLSTTVTSAAIDAGPRWLDPLEVVPLAPHEAARAAISVLEPMSLSPSEWIVEEITLVRRFPIGPHYVVKFRPVDGGDLMESVPTSFLDVVVYLDGSAVAPL